MVAEDENCVLWKLHARKNMKRLPEMKNGKWRHFLSVFGKNQYELVGKEGDKLSLGTFISGPTNPIYPSFKMHMNQSKCLYYIEYQY